MQGRRTKNEEIVHKYIDEFFEKSDTAEGSLLREYEYESLILAQDKRWRRT